MFVSSSKCVGGIIVPNKMANKLKSNGSCSSKGLNETEIRCKRSQTQFICQAASSQGGVSEVGDEGGSRHAVLHDFCMMIPYGFTAFACGGVSLLFKGGEAGMIVAGCGLAVLLMSYASLSVWKKGESSLAYTFVSTCLAGVISWQMWQRVQLHMAWLPSMVMLVLSAATALFGLYNMLAGGNPPKKQEPPAQQS